jgi:hypothetical protein
MPLTQGKFALVDECDYEYLVQWKWYYSNSGYVVRNEYAPLNKKQTTVLMHRVILERKALRILRIQTTETARDVITDDKIFVRPALPEFM